MLARLQRALPIGLLLAVLGSLALHVPAYVGLGVLQGAFAAEADQHREPVWLELASFDPGVDDEAPDEEVEGAPETDRHARPRELDDDTPDLEEEPEPEPEPEEEEPEPETQQAPPVAQPEDQERLAVIQRSQDPTVEAPDNARFLAEENNRVEEETQARVTNRVRDDPEPEAASPEAPDVEEEPGDAEETEVAQREEVEGEERELGQGNDVTEAEAAPRTAAMARQEPAREAAERPAGEPRPEPSAPATRTVTITDSSGTFRVQVPVTPETESGEGGDGAIARAGSQSRRPNLGIGWNDFEAIYGEEELARQRELRAMQRRSSRRGARRNARWRRFQAARENYVSDVRVGNHTALNARASPFAAYMHQVHDQIHQSFAGRFLRDPPASTEQHFAQNPDMHAELEIGIDEEGRIERIGIVATSGEVLFDLGAFTAVMDAQPFPSPPAAIRSPNGLTYFRWGFYRNNRQCGTFNARNIILAGAPPRPRDRAN